MSFHKDDWLEMYKHAIAEPFSFLYLNCKKPKHLRCMKRFDKYLFFNETVENKRINAEKFEENDRDERNKELKKKKD